MSGTLFETPAFDGEMTEAVRKTAQSNHLHAVEQVLDGHAVDLIHYHGLDFSAYLPASPVKKIATLHLPCAWYPDAVFRLGNVQFVCVSNSQARTLPPHIQSHIIPNGIDTDQYSPGPAIREHLLWLGRICPEKGVHFALEVAHALDLPMIVAGPVHPFRDHERYFRDRVAPLLDSRRRYIGPVGLPQKQEIFAGAICLLLPSLVEETSSLVAMEALSCGTPVIAYRAGALPEVIEDGLSGFIVASQHEMTEAVARIGEISHETCRERAVTRFHVDRMIEDYVNLYESL